MSSQEILNCIFNNLENNDNSKIDEICKVTDLLNVSENCYSLNDYKNYIFFNRDQFIENRQSVSSFLVENKFHDICWEILLEDSSSLSSDISSLKILIKITYFNMSDLNKKELKLILDEKSFEEFYEECKRIYKNF